MFFLMNVFKNEFAAINLTCKTIVYNFHSLGMGSSYHNNIDLYISVFLFIKNNHMLPIYTCQVATTSDVKSQFKITLYF